MPFLCMFASSSRSCSVSSPEYLLGEQALVFEIPSKVILQLFGALAPPLILVAVTHVLMTTEISGRTAGRLAGLLLLNTTVAIVIGILRLRIC